MADIGQEALEAYVLSTISAMVMALDESNLYRMLALLRMDMERSGSPPKIEPLDGILRRTPSLPDQRRRLYFQVRTAIQAERGDLRDDPSVLSDFPQDEV